MAAVEQGFSVTVQARPRARGRSWAVLAAVLLSSLGVAFAVGAADTAGSAKVWEEAAGLQAVTADTVDAAARIFDSPDYQRQLLVPGKGDHVFVLNLKDQSIGTLPRTAVTWSEQEQAVVDLSAEEFGGAFASEDGMVTFQTAGGGWTIRPEPPLIGAVSLEKLRAAKPDYVYAAGRYRPDPASVQGLKGVGETKVAVFFGTWCTFCKHYLPAFLKTLEETGNPKITVEFFGMSEDLTEPADAIKKYGVTQTPSFVFLQEGKEVGRIEEEPDVSIEADMVAILK